MDGRRMQSKRSKGSALADWLAYGMLTIFIIAVIAAVLFPMFTRREDCTYTVGCPGLLKECAVALQLYWNDYDSHLPSSYLVSHSKKWSRRDSLMFISKLGEMPPTANTRLQTWPQVLYGHMKNKDIMWCPSDSADTSNRNSQVSYWYKLANDKAWYGEGCTKPCRTEADFQYNADQICFYEHQGWHCGRSDGLKNDVMINASFMDSHVEAIVVKSATSGNPINCAANSDGEPMYFNYDNKTHKRAAGPARYTDPQRYSDMF